MQILVILLLLLLLPALCSASAASYDIVEGLDCVNDEFMVTCNDCANERLCAAACSDTDSCQAFTFLLALCRLFVFDQCSKSVRDCSCSKMAKIFVKKNNGLPQGSLCPTTYTHDRCGVKYRFVTTTRRWNEQKAECDSDGGLAMMADVMDAGEEQHVREMAFNISSSSTYFFIASKQALDAVEPAGGFNWNCGGEVQFNAWNKSGLNNNGNDVLLMFYDKSHVIDVSETLHRKAMCECLSVFN